MIATPSIFSGKCMSHRNKEINNIFFSEVFSTCDEKLYGVRAEYMDTVIFTTLLSQNYAHSKNWTSDIKRVDK